MKNIRRRTLAFAVALCIFGPAMLGFGFIGAALASFVLWKPLVVGWGIIRALIALSAFAALRFAMSDDAL